jgi:hypothetical protein
MADMQAHLIDAVGAAESARPALSGGLSRLMAGAKNR